ncbi:MAG: two-component regulator propeller domain-containing protein [Sphingobacteriales bacterium]
MLKILSLSNNRIQARPAPRLVCLFIVMLLSATVCRAQKYTFSHYDIEDGLIQSQVNNLCIDNEHRLWMATYGGACRYDGMEFMAYTRQNDMPTNFVNTVFTDKDDNVWFGTQTGPVKLVNNKPITFKVPGDLQNLRTRNIVQDKSGAIWAIINNKLFKITGNTVKQLWVQDTIKESLDCIATDKSGTLFASVYRKGLYSLVNGKWITVVSYATADRNLFVAKILFNRTDNTLYLQSYSGIYTVNNGQLQPYQSKLISSIKAYLLSVTQDADNNFWLGTSNGAYYLKGQQVIHFNANNGLTDNAVSDVFCDADNNIWLASQGNGLFKYEGDHFTMLDKSQGMTDNQVVMAVVNDKKGGVIMGIDGGGLMRYDGKKLLPMGLEKKNAALKNIVSLYADAKGTLWIGTHNGLWTYAGNTLTLIKGLMDYAINGITGDSNGTIWVTTHSACFYIENNEAKLLDGFSHFSSSIITLGRDSVIIGTDDGVQLAVDKKIVKAFKLDEVKTSVIFCMIQYKDMLIIGTDDRGVFTWDRTTGQVKNYTVKDGLNSNAIYSMARDDNGIIWAGTGRGTNRLMFDAKKNSFAITGNGGSKSIILESNQNAALYINNKVWIGTTKGAVIYNVNSAPGRTNPPRVVIQSARLIPTGPGNSWENSKILSNGTKLPYGQNHIAIWFLGVYLKNSAEISYRYKLKGLDSTYSALVKDDVVDYPSLPPGNYTFEVKAVTADGTSSINTAKFSFVITPPFYQTTWFRLAGIAFFILLGIGLQSYRHRVKINRLKIIEATKREESLKIRQQTAEDFHDELGNKLTRITVLSEILDTKMDKGHTDQKKLLEQIKQNASSLYNGTKDILWALDPQSDNLYEILNHIKDFGNELFLDTPVEFEFNGIDESLNEIKLPMEYSRNIPMIFKELLNNILKHAHATQVTLNLDAITKDDIQLTLCDNGCGFIQSEAPKGQGMNNMMMRTKRIGGNINISSEKGMGTVVKLNIKLTNIDTL